MGVVTQDTVCPTPPVIVEPPLVNGTNVTDGKNGTQ